MQELINKLQEKLNNGAQFELSNNLDSAIITNNSRRLDPNKKTNTIYQYKNKNIYINKPINASQNKSISLDFTLEHKNDYWDATVFLYNIQKTHMQKLAKTTEGLTFSQELYRGLNKESKSDFTFITFKLKNNEPYALLQIDCIDDFYRNEYFEKYNNADNTKKLLTDLLSKPLSVIALIPLKEIDDTKNIPVCFYIKTQTLLKKGHHLTTTTKNLKQLHDIIPTFTVLHGNNGLYYNKKEKQNLILSYNSGIKFTDKTEEIYHGEYFSCYDKPNLRNICFNNVEIFLSQFIKQTIQLEGITKIDIDYSTLKTQTNFSTISIIDMLKFIEKEYNDSEYRSYSGRNFIIYPLIKNKFLKNVNIINSNEELRKKALTAWRYVTNKYERAIPSELLNNVDYNLVNPYKFKKESFKYLTEKHTCFKNKNNVFQSNLKQDTLLWLVSSFDTTQVNNLIFSENDDLFTFIPDQSSTLDVKKVLLLNRKELKNE